MAIRLGYILDLVVQKFIAVSYQCIEFWQTFEIRINYVKRQRKRLAHGIGIQKINFVSLTQGWRHFNKHGGGKIDKRKLNIYQQKIIKANEWQFQGCLIKSFHIGCTCIKAAVSFKTTRLPSFASSTVHSNETWLEKYGGFLFSIIHTCTFIETMFSKSFFASPNSWMSFAQGRI